MGTDRLYFGMVGNGETGALIGPIWPSVGFACRDFDGTPFFASALDPRARRAIVYRTGRKAGGG